MTLPPLWLDCLHKSGMREREFKAGERDVACGYITNVDIEHILSILGLLCD